MAEPVSLAEARSQVNIIDAGETTFDAYLTSLIPMARATVERMSTFFWLAASRSEVFGSWGDDHYVNRIPFGRLFGRSRFIEIYRGPIASIDSITYGPNGDDTAYTTFVAPLGRFPLRIYPAPESELPQLQHGDVITVNYTSGALDPSSEEYLVGKQAMLLLIGHWFANREAVVAETRVTPAEVPIAVTYLLDSLSPVSVY